MSDPVDVWAADALTAPSTPLPSSADLIGRIFETMPGGIVQLDHDGRIHSANRQAQLFLGLSADALTRRFIADFELETLKEDGSLCPVEDYPAARCLRTGRAQPPATIGVRTPDGAVRWAIFTALPHPASDGRLGAVVTFVEITERRRAERRARAHHQLLGTVRMVHLEDELEASTTAFAEALDCFLELTGSRFGFIASVESESGRDPSLRIRASHDLDRDERAGSTPPPVALDALSERALTSGRRVSAPSPGPLGGGFGRREPKAAVVFPLLGADRAVGVVGFADAPRGYEEGELSDLEPLIVACADLVAAFDDRRRRGHLEAQLAQAERLASVGTLAAGMAHEINNPLAYVLLTLETWERRADKLAHGFSRLSGELTQELGEERARALLERAGLGPEPPIARLVQHARDARMGAERVQHIVRDLMTFSRVAEERKGLVDVNSALEVALKLANHEIKYRARLVCELSPTLPPVRGHDGRLSQVFLNILLNAARAIDEGPPDDNRIGVRSWGDQHEVHVEITDTGAGVSPEHLARIFEPFFSTRAPGSGAGLGLSICHNIIAAHGGRIGVTSERSAGTKFLVSLPTSQAVPEGTGVSSSRPSPAAADGARARVLLIDDDPMVRRVLAQLLRRSYEVSVAEGLTSAIATLASGEPVDLILCDMMMLDGTGVDVHAWVSAHRPKLATRIVFMTGGTFTPKAREFLQEQADHQLLKPFAKSDLDEIFARILIGASDEE